MSGDGRSNVCRMQAFECGQRDSCELSFIIRQTVQKNAYLMKRWFLQFLYLKSVGIIKGRRDCGREIGKETDKSGVGSKRGGERRDREKEREGETSSSESFLLILAMGRKG